MTTVGDMTPGDGGQGGGLAGARGRFARSGTASQWSRLWQIPLFLLGLAVFVVGVRFLVKAIKPVPFATHVADVRKLLEGGEYTRAIDRVNELVEYFKEPLQIAELQALAGDAFYLYQMKQEVDGGAYVRENWVRVGEHYEKAVAFGAKPSAVMNERWGEAALKLGDAKQGIEKFEAAGATDPAALEAHAKQLIAAYLVRKDLAKAEGMIDRMLAAKDLSVDDRTWGLCKKIELGMEAGGGEGLKAAIEMARHALVNIPERDPAGRILVWLGRAEFEEGHIDQAKQDLTEAQKQFVSHSVDDGRAAVLLGRIAQMHKEWDRAGECFQEVVTSHTGTSLWAAARLGRAEVQAMRGEAGETMKGDYEYAISAVSAKEAGPIEEKGEGRGRAEMITREQVRASLVRQYDRATAAGKLDDALLFLALVQEMKEPEDASMAYRLATTREKRGLELLEEAKKLAGEARDVKQGEGMTMLAQAAEDYVRHSKLTTMTDDVSGNSLWRAAQLFDMAGKGMRSAAVYEQFTVQRPRDPRVAEGLLAMGRIYQSAGMLDKAIGLYERNISENGKAAPSYTSAVNLARCYVLRDPEGYSKAEKVLLTVVQDNPDLLPTAKEFRTALFALGELYYRQSLAELARAAAESKQTGKKVEPRADHVRWADAILRLEEVLERYPSEEGAARTMFLLADSYSKSAAEIRAAIDRDPAIDHRDLLEMARSKRLERGKALFGQVIALLDPSPELGGGPGASKLTALEQEYLRSSYMNRAACAYALARYTEAIKLYDAVASRYSQDVAAIEAYVQIVNCYMALQQPAQAAAAAERARWILKRIPDDAFGRGPLALSRDYYDGLLQLGKAQ